MPYSFVTPQDFGAVGDYAPAIGGTDDTAAFQAAIDAVVALPNGELYVPPPQPGRGYQITQSLKPSGPIKIVCPGPNAVTIWGHDFAPGVPLIDYDFTPGQGMEHFKIAGLALRSNNGNPIGIRAKNVSYLHIEDVRAYGLADGVIYTGDRCFSNSADRLVGYGVTGSTVKWNSHRGGGQFTFENCTFSGNIGVLQDNDSVTDRVHIGGSNWEGCGFLSMRVCGTLDGLWMDPRTEGCLGPYDFVFSPEADPRGGVHHQSAIVCEAGIFTSNSATTRALIFGGNAGTVSGVALFADKTMNSSADVFAYMYGNVENVVAMGNVLSQPNSTLINAGAVVPGMFARANRNGSAQLANIG